MPPDRVAEQGSLVVTQAAAVPIAAVNDFVIKFATVNGSGSSRTNSLFASALFRMGLSVAPKNIFPSNIQGLPTWFEVRVSDRGFIGRRGGVDLAVALNPQSAAKDLAELSSGGYFLYDSTRPLDPALHRDDINYLPVPLTRLCAKEFLQARQRELLRNMCYVGVLAELLGIETTVLHQLLEEQFGHKPKLVALNKRALELSRDYAREHQLSIGLRVERRERDLPDAILLNGNAALALGAIYAGATVAAWYPITPSTSVVEAFERYAKRFRHTEDGAANYAVVQAEDELAAIGMVIGAGWNGARAFTATSGPGISLMAEFLGLAYFAELPVVLYDVQRVGPSTGLPTRTQQSDVLAAAYASHGDTRHVLLFPASVAECFELSAQAFDLAEQLQTPIIVMTDLDTGMNDHISPPLRWTEGRRYDRGRVLDAEDLDRRTQRYGRYLDEEGDGICARTLPGTHADKGAFFTRGTARDPYAIYSEEGGHYEANMQRLLRKWRTAAGLVPEPVLEHGDGSAELGVLCYGSSADAMLEAAQRLGAERGLAMDVLRVRAFPFSDSVREFCAAHRQLFIVEQNRDAQLRTLLIQECGSALIGLQALCHYDGTPITADFIVAGISAGIEQLADGAAIEHIGAGSQAKSKPATQRAGKGGKKSRARRVRPAAVS